MDLVSSAIEKYKNEMVEMSKRRKNLSEDFEFQDKTENNNTINTVTDSQANKNQSENNFGTLKVAVFAGNRAYPLESATVEVKDKFGKTLYFKYTDSSGIAEDMPLPAPLFENSQSPNMKDPYYNYSVEVKHPLYQAMKKDDVQIFPNVESVQPFFLNVDKEAE